MIIDTSALVAIRRQEPEWRLFMQALDETPLWGIPASVYLEFAMVSHRDGGARSWLEALIADYGAPILPIDGPIVRIAADAFARYGRGRGHPANLNFGDCLAYAAARKGDAALLFKGDDFRHTDVKAAR